MTSMGILLVVAALSVPAPVLPFVEDDYAGALSAARGKKLPIFVEAWAPW